MSIKYRKSAEFNAQLFATEVNLLLDAALTTQVHRDKTSVPTGDWFTPSSTPLLIAGATTNLETCVALTNELKGALYFHMNDDSAHLVVDSVNVAFDGYQVDGYIAASTTFAQSVLCANAMKLNYNSHMAQSGVHQNNDSTHTVTASASTDLASLKTLLADLKSKVNLHFADAGTTQRLVYVNA